MLDSTEPMAMMPDEDLLQYISLEAIEAESLFDLIDEDMNYPNWD